MAGNNKTLKPMQVGTSRNLKVTIKDKVTKLPIDVSGDKFYFTVKNTPDLDDADAVVQVSVVTPNDATSQAGIAIIPVTASDTTSVDPGSYVYDIMWLKLTSSPGDREPVVAGDISFEQAVTHAQT
jgi:hypothetical protein